MSRIGKQPISIPDKVEVNATADEVTVKGPKGEMSIQLPSEVTVESKDNQLIVSVKDEHDKQQRAFWGTLRSRIQNMVHGATEGYQKQLEINGVGYTANVQGKKLVLNVGYSHQVDFDMPEGIEISTEKNIITVSGMDKQLVGQTAAEIRSIRKPEPYKGKGIKYVDEHIKRKAGKMAKGAEA